MNLGDLFQNWNPDTGLSNSPGCTVDGGVIEMLEPNLYKRAVMLPGITYSTDVETLMITNRFASAYIRMLDKIKVQLVKASDNAAFRVEATQGDGKFLEIKCNDVLKVGEVVAEPIDSARVSGQTADRVQVAVESYDEVRELVYLNYLINGGASADPTDVGAPASPNTNQTDYTNILESIIKDDEIIRLAGARVDTLIISEQTASMFFIKIDKMTFFRAGSEAEVAVLGAAYAGTLFSGRVRIFTSNAVGQDNSAYVDEAAGTPEWDWSNVEYVLYDHRTLAIVNIVRFFGLVDYRAIIHASTLISILTVCGGRVRNPQKAIAKKFATTP